MPMLYTDETLLECSEFRFREKRNDESMDQYRREFAQDVQPRDPVDAHEIRTGTPWNKWSREQFDRFLAIGNNASYAMRNPGMLSLFDKFASDSEVD